MGRKTKMVAYGLGGIALALAMSVGTFALAGSTLSQPPPTVRIVGVTQTPRPHAATATPTASPDDHGGDDDNSGPGGGGGHDDD